MEPAHGYKTRNVYLSLKGAKTSPSGAKIGPSCNLFTQADSVCVQALLRNAHHRFKFAQAWSSLKQQKLRSKYGN